MEIVITALFLLFISVREYFVHQERQKLLDRIMANSLVEYKDIVQPPDPDEEIEEDETLDIVNAQEELMGGEDGQR
jgi:hypothetical protein